MKQVGHILSYYLMAFLMSVQGDNYSKFTRRPSSLYQLRFLSFFFWQSTTKSIWNTHFNTPEPDGTQHDGPFSCYRPAVFFHHIYLYGCSLQQKKLGAFKNALMLLF